MKWEQYIESNPEILFGKPIVKGTRISVELILEKLGEGISVVQLLEAYPHINSDQIHACLLFASKTLKSQFIFPIAS